jgi:hypothetical protein
MQNVIQKFSNRRLITILGILLLANLLLFSLPGFPGSRSAILANAPEQKIPDMMGFYSPQEVYDFLSTIGPAGRAAYQMMHFSTDLAFPIVYGLFLFAWLCRLVIGMDLKLQYLPVLAFLASAADLAENFSMVFITNRFPEFLPGLTRLAQGFSLVKFAGIGICITIGIIFTVRNHLKERKIHSTAI